MPNVDLTRIGSNIGAMYSLQSLLDINNKLAASQTRLSTGKRINSAADDPAGLVIATKMSARSEGLRVSMDNISDAKNMLSVAEGGLSKMTDILIKMRSKATQAASDTLGVTERDTIQTQLSAFAGQIQDLIDETKWNGVKILDGTADKIFQTGVDEGETTTWKLSSLHDPTTLGVSNKVTAATGTLNGTNGAASMTALGSTGVKGSFSEFNTGTYKFHVLSTSGSVAEAFSSLDVDSISASSGSITVATPGSAQVALEDDNYTVEFTGFSASSTSASGVLSYTVTGASSGSYSATVDVANAGSSVNLVNSSGCTIGISVNFDEVYDTDDLGSFTFSYAGEVDASATISIENYDGVALDVSTTADGAGASGSSFTASVGQVWDSGKGATFTIGNWAGLLAAEALTTPETFTYLQENDFSVDVSTAAKAGQYMTAANSALDKVNSTMADLGSLMARMSIKEEAASSARINVESAYSRIMNANMAEEQVNASKYLVLQQTAVAMLAQANNAPQALLSLFQ
jgi:flagellin